MTRFKKYKFLLISLILTIGMTYGSCSKDDTGPVVQVNFHKQSLDSIRYYMEGLWHVRFAEGGATGRGQQYSNTDFTFFNSDSISWMEGSSIRSRSKITWIKVRVGPGDSAYIFQYGDYRSGGSPTIMPIRRSNDTLVLEENAADGYTYFMTSR